MENEKLVSRYVHGKISSLKIVVPKLGKIARIRNIMYQNRFFLKSISLIRVQVIGILKTKKKKIQIFCISTESENAITDHPVCRIYCYYSRAQETRPKGGGGGDVPPRCTTLTGAVATRRIYIFGAPAARGRSSRAYRVTATDPRTKTLLG